MLPSSDVLLLGVAVLMQILGIAAAISARLSQTPVARKCSYRVFYVSLLAVFAITLLAVHVGHGVWISTGTTLAIMAVGATLDVGSPEPASAF
jgi:hypothetical protein